MLEWSVAKNTRVKYAHSWEWMCGVIFFSLANQWTDYITGRCLLQFIVERFLI